MQEVRNTSLRDMSQPVGRGLDGTYHKAFFVSPQQEFFSRIASLYAESGLTGDTVYNPRLR